jgi:hypothetical protein
MSVKIHAREKQLVGNVKATAILSAVFQVEGKVIVAVD